MYNVFMLSLDESQTAKHFDILREWSPTARLIQGVDGIYQAHRKCAINSTTSHFFVVDADTKVIDGTVFEYTVPKHEQHLNYTHLWYNNIPAIDAIYGYAGIKLFPTAIFKDDTITYLDMTTTISVGMKIHTDVVSQCEFHLDDNVFIIWRSALRETYKLAKNLSPMVERWLHPNKNSDNWPIVQHGANIGNMLAATDTVNINDYATLWELYQQYFIGAHRG